MDANGAASPGRPGNHRNAPAPLQAPGGATCARITKIPPPTPGGSLPPILPPSRRTQSHLDGFGLESQAVEGVDGFFGVFRVHVIDKSVAQTLACERRQRSGLIRHQSSKLDR